MEDEELEIGPENDLLKSIERVGEKLAMRSLADRLQLIESMLEQIMTQLQIMEAKIYNSPSPPTLPSPYTNPNWWNQQVISDNTRPRYVGGGGMTVDVNTTKIDHEIKIDEEKLEKEIGELLSAGILDEDTKAFLLKNVVS